MKDATRRHTWAESAVNWEINPWTFLCFPIPFPLHFPPSCYTVKGKRTESVSSGDRRLNSSVLSTWTRKHTFFGSQMIAHREKKRTRHQILLTLGPSIEVVLELVSYCSVTYPVVYLWSTLLTHHHTLHCSSHILVVFLRDVRFCCVIHMRNQVWAPDLRSK